jgi:hypothetical protein
MTHDPADQCNTSSVLRVGDGAQMGNVTIGDVAGRDIVITHITQIVGATPPPYRAAVTRMAEDYGAVFGGRDAELAQLDAWLTQDTQPCAFLHAPTGRGKTALLQHWVAQIQQRGDWHVVVVPISIRYQTASAVMAVGALATALAAFHGETDKLQTYNQTPDQLRPVIADYLRRAPNDERRLLVVLDGLDEAVGWQVARDLFPREPGPQLRLLASARQKAHTSRADWLERLGWQTAQTCDLELAGLRRAAVQDILRRMGNPLDQLATDVNLLAKIERVSEGDPLTIRFLIEALRDGTLTPGKLTGLPPGLEAYVKDWLKELRQQSRHAEEVYTLLTLCAVALGPLSKADIEHLAPERLARRLDRIDAAASVARFLIGDGSAQSGYVLSHPRLRELFVEQVLSPRERTESRQRFVDHGKAWYADRRQALPAYLRQFWIMHLVEAGEWELTQQILTEVVPTGADGRYQQPWAEARSRAEGSYAGYLADLDRLWGYAENRNAFALGLRCALIASSVRSLSGNLSPELLVGLVTIGTPEGKWSPAAALEHVRQMPNPQRQAEALRTLAQCGCELSFAQALDVARGIVDDNARARALGALALHLRLPTFCLWRWRRCGGLSTIMRGLRRCAIWPPTCLPTFCLWRWRRCGGLSTIMRGLRRCAIWPRICRRTCWPRRWSWRGALPTRSGGRGRGRPWPHTCRSRTKAGFGRKRWRRRGGWPMRRGGCWHWGVWPHTCLASSNAQSGGKHWRRRGEFRRGGGRGRWGF